MALESATYISDLVSTNPVGPSDPKSQGDDHLRMIKAVLKATFPNLNGAVTLTPTQMNQAAFPAGTKMLFVQTSAPTGWTKDVTHDNKALRIVTGTAGTGGSVNFTTVFTSKAVTGTTNTFALLATHLPAHTHTQTGSFNSGFVSADHTHFISGTTSVEQQAHNHGFTYVDTHAGGGGVQGTGGAYGPYTAGTTATENQNHTHAFSGSTGGISANHFHTTTISGETGSIGSGTGHSHAFTGTAIDMSVQYVDSIICTKT